MHIFGGVPLLNHLALGDVCSERARIDRRVEMAVHVGHAAHVVLMGVGDKDTIQTVRLLREPRHIRQDHIHARSAVHVRKGDA